MSFKNWIVGVCSSALVVVGCGASDSGGEAGDRSPELASSAASNGDVAFATEPADYGAEPIATLPALDRIEIDGGSVSFFDEGEGGKARAVSVLASGSAVSILRGLERNGAISSLEVFLALAPERALPDALLEDHAALAAKGEVPSEPRLFAVSAAKTGLKLQYIEDRPRDGFHDCTGTDETSWNREYWHDFSANYGSNNLFGRVERDVDLVVPTSNRHAIAACMADNCSITSSITTRLLLRNSTDSGWDELDSRTLTVGHGVYYRRSTPTGGRRATMQLRGLSLCEDTIVGAAWTPVGSFITP
jgi:hypothetical protein